MNSLPARIQIAKECPYPKPLMAADSRSTMTFEDERLGSLEEEQEQDCRSKFLKIPWGILVLETTGVCKRVHKEKWRRRIYGTIVLMLTFLVYMSFHLSRVTIGTVKIVLLPECRRSHSYSNTTEICTSLQPASNHSNETCPPGWQPFLGPEGATRLGILDSSFLFTYAVCMFISGYIGDRVPLRYFLSIGMFGAAVSISLFGMAFFLEIHSLAYFIIIQILGGMFQSTGWPVLVAIVANWFGMSKRGTIMGFWNWHTSIGNLLGYLIPGIWAHPDSWGWSFLAAGFIMFSINLAIFLFLPTDPEMLGLPSPQHQERPESTDSKETKAESESDPIEKTSLARKKRKRPAVKFFQALKIPGVIEYSLALFFAKLITYTFLFWLPFYVSNTRVGGVCLSTYEAALLAGLFDVGAMIGSLLIGFLSDIIHSRAISCLISFVLAIPLVLLYLFYGYVNLGASIFLITMAGITVNAAYALITTSVSADLGTHKIMKDNKKAKATVAAIIDGTGSFGGAIGPFLAGFINDQYGWPEVFYLIIACCLAAGLMVSRIVVKDVIRGFKYLKRKCSALPQVPLAVKYKTAPAEDDRTILIEDDSNNVLHAK